VLENDPKGQLTLAADQGAMMQEDAHYLIENHSLLTQIQHISRLLVAGEFDINALSKAGLSHILTATGYKEITALEDAMMSKTKDAEAIILKYLTSV
jgi:hypothetical protein